MSTSEALITERSVGGALPREKVLLGLLALSITMVVMNTTMFNLALPSIIREFGLTASAASWIVTGYSIVFSISSITFSRLTDFVPIRRLFVISLTGLSLVSIIGLFAPNYATLLIVRLIQAAGAGAIPSLSLVYTTRYIPVARRGKANVNIIAAVSLGLGLGPVAAGLIMEFWGWRELFAVTAAILLIIPFLAATLPTEQPGKGTLDVKGALLIGLGTTGLLMFVTNDYRYALILGILALGWFVFHINRMREPFIQPSLFRNRAYLKLLAIGITAYMCNFANLFLMPQVLIQLHGLSAVQAGLVIFPGSLAAVLLSRFVGTMIDAIGNSIVLRVFPFLLLASSVLFALYADHSSTAVLFIYVLMSIGFTFLTGSVTNEVSRRLEGRFIGSGMGLLQLLQFFSGAFGVGLTARSISWLSRHSPDAVYPSVYWGMSGLAVLTLGSATFYLKGKRPHRAA